MPLIASCLRNLPTTVSPNLPRCRCVTMNFDFSSIGSQLAAGSGIEELMDDLGQALQEGGPKVHMLGGGNPAAIPEVTAVWRDQMRQLLDVQPERFDRMLVNYDPCRGNSRFLDALAGLFNRTYGWQIDSSNLAVTNGGQTAFFYLFNLLAGEFPSGRRKKILLPLVPEYIGYANQGVHKDVFRAVKPSVDLLDQTTFKYRVDFDSLHVSDDIGAICASRPTNPTGNVLTDAEMDHLRELAADHGIPLIVDNAYGTPFPNVVFEDVKPVWGENVILTYSLSKLGLPGTRTGIVVGPPQIAQAISSMNAVVGLACGNIGQALVTPLIEDGRLLEISRQIIRPFYQRKSQDALRWLAESLPRGSYRVHKSEGALFLWIWFPELPITTRELYERLKARGRADHPRRILFLWDGSAVGATRSVHPPDVFNERRRRA